MSHQPFHLFEVAGVELEYMIVDRGTMNVAPVADQLLAAADAASRGVAPGEGNAESDPEFVGQAGAIGWSNELARHVIEFKTAHPVRTLDGLGDEFHANVKRANQMLSRIGAGGEGSGCCLLPAAMHMWMDPLKEMQIWPHGYKDVYEAFDRIFSCKGHGWANLQSMHINLPFSGDEEFGRLHAAIRLVLPILPALAASSPIMEGRATGLMDNRLEVYRHNSKRVPSVAGKVIPEPVYTESDYRKEILERIWHDLSPLDPAGVLRHEWANARGCIARFTRGSIEIRVIDVQECPAADIGIARAVIGLVERLVNTEAAERAGGAGARRAWPVQRLHEIFLCCVREADEAVIGDLDYLRAVGVDTHSPMRARELWRLLAAMLPASAGSDTLKVILEHGCLSRRILTRLGVRAGERTSFTGDRGGTLRQCATELADCLSANHQLLC
ncbi:MAG: glutamate-cysteine ligase family protein [Phycisphaerales bacterium]